MRKLAKIFEPSAAELRVLVALSDGAQHGYYIMLATGLGASVVYPALTRLRQARMITRSAKEPGADKRRQSYTLTARGTEAMRAALGRMAAVVDAARQNKLLPASAG